MSMNNNAKALLFAANPAGTNSCIPTDVNAIPCRSLTYSFKANSVERTLAKPYFGNNPKAIVGTYGEIQVEVELVGGQNNGIAKAGAAPYYEPLLLCAGYVVTTTAFGISAEIQGSTTSIVTLADTASSTDGTYDFWTIALALSAETARNQITQSSDKIYLADTKLLNETVINPHNSVTQSGSTATAIKLANGASSVDDYYNGYTLIIAGEQRVILDYVGSTRIATVAELSAVPDVGTAYTVTSATAIKLANDASSVDDYYNGDTLIINGEQRFITDYVGSTRTAIVPALSAIPANNARYKIIHTALVRSSVLRAGSTQSVIILDASASSIDGFYNGNKLTISNHETIITAYNGTTKTAVVSPPLPTKPAVGVNYAIRSDVVVSALKCGSSSTTTAIVLSNLASSSTNFYNGMILAIGSESKIITAYNGTTKTATVSSAFASAPTSGTEYTITATAEVERKNVVGDNSSTTEVQLDTLASSEYQYYAGMRLLINDEMVVIDSYDKTTKIAGVLPALSTAPALGDVYTIFYNDDHYAGLPISVRHFSGRVINNGDTTASKIYLPDSVISNIELWGLDLVITHAGITEKRRIYIRDKANDYVVVTTAFSFTPSDGDYFEISEAAEITAFNGITKIAILNKNLRIYPKSNSAYQIDIERIVKSYNGNTQKATVTPKLPIAPPAGSLCTLEANRTYTLKTPSRTSPLQTGTGYFFIDGVLHSITGALVTASIELGSGNIPVLKATITGLIDLYQNETMPYFNRADYIDALPVNEANTNTVYINGFENAVLEKISFDTGNKIEYRNMPNFEGIICNNRAPKGSFNIEATDANTRNWFATIANEDKGAVIISHGITNNRVTLGAANAQFENHAYGDSQSITMNSMDFMPLPIIGNDEFKIVVS